MSLQRKTLLVVISTVIISTVSLYLASQFTLLQGYEKIEQDDTRANVLRTVNSFYDQSRSIDLVARGYAFWDEMYYLVQEPNQKFLDSLGLTPNLYATLKVNLIAILDTNYRPIFLKMYDLETLEPIDIPSDLLPYLQTGSPLLGHTIASAEKNGVIVLGGRPMYVASMGTLHTDFTGAARGAVIMGRFLDDTIIQNLAEATKLSVSAYLLDDAQTPGDITEAIAGLKASTDEQPVYVKRLDSDRVAGYTFIKTVTGQPAFVLKVALPRTIYTQGLTSFRYFATLAAVAGLVFIIVSMLLLRHFVLRPLTQLSQQISLIRARGDNSQRVPVRGQDELASLSVMINDMLEALERHTEERYRSLVENINDVIFVLDSQGCFSYVSPVIERLTGYTAGEVMAQPFVRFVHPDDLPDLTASFERAMAGISEPAEFRVLTKEGVWLYIRTHSRLLREGDKIAGITGIMTDITGRKRAEQALTESQQYLQVIFNSVNEAIFIHDATGNILDVNATAGQMYGYSQEEFLRLSIEDLSAAAPTYSQVEALNWLEKARQGEPQLFEWQAKSKTGHTFWAEVNARFARVGQDERFFVTIRDITERKQVEAEREKLISTLEAQNAELERFTYTVSHDLKSPLVTIANFLGFLEKDALAGNQERLKTDLNRIKVATKQMQQLLDELLELSRLGRLINPPQSVPFEAIVAEALALTQGRLTECGVTVEVARDWPTVYGDRLRLVEVIQNLVDNAAKYMGDQPQPHIEIGLRQQGSEPVFLVKDNGIGIEPQYQQRVFGLFDKLDPHTEGTGIGLAMVKRIVELHGGRIWIESEGQGQGSTFCFTLNSSP